MDRTQQFKARNAVVVRSETVTFRLDARLKFLADLAARSQGRKLGNFVEMAVENALQTVVIVDERELNAGTEGVYSPMHGKTLADVADSLWSRNEAIRFLNVFHTVPWLLTDGESKLLRILQHSDYFAPLVKGARILHSGRIQEHWTVLAAIRDGEANVYILPVDQRPSGALAFGLMSEAERVALYKSDPAKYKRESAVYTKAMKEGASK
jgi:hypothetical protein